MEDEPERRARIDNSQHLSCPQTLTANGAYISQLGQPTISGMAEQDSKSQSLDTPWTKATLKKKREHVGKIDASKNLDQNRASNKVPSDGTTIMDDPFADSS